MVTGGSAPDGLSQALGVAPAFHVAVHYRPLRPVGAAPDDAPDDASDDAPDVRGPLIAVAGIARPQRFVAALRAQGHDVAGEVVFRDHHWFTAGDIERIEQLARDAGARWIVTTEKDAVRLPPVGAAWLRLPMRVAIEPVGQFAGWLAAQLAASRAATARGGPEARDRRHDS